MKLHSLVLDASTLILLAKIDLLPMAAERVSILIPREVRDEALAKPEVYDAQIIARMLREGKILVREERAARKQKEICEQFRIDSGEAAALILAMKKKCAIGIDDGPGIRAAKVLGVPFVTAMHVLVEFCERGIIDEQSAMAKLDSLQMAGRYHIQIVEDARASIRKRR